LTISFIFEAFPIGFLLCKWWMISFILLDSLGLGCLKADFIFLKWSFSSQKVYPSVSRSSSLFHCWIYLNQPHF
jgi:hypothetical protein